MFKLISLSESGEHL